MVFYFKARPEVGDYTIFMGLDEHENEQLIKYGLPQDIWFHVDNMSSAHVYVRLRKGQGIDDMPEGLLEDCAQLVKANSIQGNKVNNVDVVYTPWQNLKKTASMDVGQVGFHNSEMVRTVRVEKRMNEVVNRLNKTKVERTPDLKAERKAVKAAERADRKLQLQLKDKGLWLAEVFNVVYRGHGELKPNRQIGSIKVNDGINNHYIYDVNKIDNHKPSIQYLDEIVLSGPRLASISAENSFTIDIDLCSGAFKDSFCISPKRDSLEICFPLEKRITSKDGKGEIIVLYAIFDNAVEAHLEIKFFADNGFTREVHGVVAASSTNLESFEYSSVLFLNKSNDKIKVGHCELFPLSRSIVAVPLESELLLDIHLKIRDEHDLLVKTVTFQAERTGVCEQLVDGKNCKIQVKVTWKWARVVEEEFRVHTVSLDGQVWNKDGSY